MSTFKRVNLTEDKLEEILREIATKLRAEVKTEKHKDGGILIKVVIPGEKEAKLKIWFKPDGATINPKLGKNQKLSVRIAEEIVNLCGALPDINKSLEGITCELLNDLLAHLEESGVRIEKAEKENGLQIKLSWHSNQRLTLHYYPRGNKLLLQGKENQIAKTILLWYADNTISNVQDIIRLVFEKYEDIEKAEEIFPEGILEEKAKEFLGEYYSLLNEQERKWLKVSLYLLKLHKDLCEYYATVAGTLKIIEGMLKRILLKHHCPFEKYYRFTQFEKDGTLKQSLRGNFKNPRQVQVVERFYRFVLDTRHKLQHANPTHSYEVDREYAEEILNEVFDLINLAGRENLL